MRKLRAVISALLLVVLFTGQLTAGRCTMLSARSESAKPVAHAHGHSHSVPAGPQLSLQQPHTPAPPQLPPPCLMTAGCQAPVIVEARVMVAALPAVHVERSFARDLSYVDPLLLVTTPPPRA